MLRSGKTGPAESGRKRYLQNKIKINAEYILIFDLCGFDKFWNLLILISVGKNLIREETGLSKEACF